jgi:tetratricopeptide (TPR) repeat protein
MRVPARSNPEPILPTDRSKPRRKLSAALQRLDRELKDLRGPAGAAPGAGAGPVHAPAQEPAAPAGAAKAHVEQLLRMRAQQMAQKKAEVETTTVVSDVYRQGQEALRDNQFARAHELLRRACELAPNDQAWQLQMQWAALRAGALDEDGIGKLRAILRELVSDNDQKKFAYYALGHLALVEKKDDAAEKFFRKAVELDKNNKDAERHLRIIELRRKSASEDRGNKIFGIEIGKKKG